MSKKTKLELTWVGKEARPRLEPRILLPDNDHCYHADTRKPDGDCFNNKLIFGDNLLALKSLEQEYTGKVKCIYIDPPYNTGNAFKCYDDGLEHSIWLGLMRDRLVLLRTLLRDDGVIFISIDDREHPYLRVLCDEIFGRGNFINEFIWQKKRGGGNDSKHIAVEHEYVVAVAKDINCLPNWYVAYDKDYLKRYSGEDDKGKYFWDTFARPGLKNPIVYEIEAPDGTLIKNGWTRSQKRFLEDYKNGEIRIIKKNDNSWSVQFKQYLGKGKKPRSLITDIAINSDAKAECASLFEGITPFDYPKPEALIKFLLDIATEEDDLVLDSFAGSGTTGAVAHKMKRRWIMIELGDHCYTHIVPRLKQVVDGTDQGGISKSVSWTGGGGFRTYKLAPSMLKKDKWGYWIIDEDVYCAERLAEAMCKHMGYTYAPDETQYWIHGHANKSAFIYVTTQTMDPQHLNALSQMVGKGRSLLICCSAFIGEADDYDNLTIKKIPQAVLASCEWGRDDYSLRVNNLPMATQEDIQTENDDLFTIKEDCNE